MDEWTSHSEEIVHDHLLLKVSNARDSKAVIVIYLCTAVIV